MDSAVGCDAQTLPQASDREGKGWGFRVYRVYVNDITFGGFWFIGFM